MDMPLTEEDFEELDQRLLRFRAGLLDVVTLEGFLTALIIGPHTIMPSVWTAKVWGSKRPPFKQAEDFRRFLELLMRFHNELVGLFAVAPEHFEPTFAVHETRGRQILIVDEWCEGFVKGMRLDPEGWKPLKRARPDLLKPIQLFGTRAGWRQIEAGGAPEMHATWSARIAPAVRDIHAFWLPYRALQGAAPPAARPH